MKLRATFLYQTFYGRKITNDCNNIFFQIDKTAIIIMVSSFENLLKAKSYLQRFGQFIKTKNMRKLSFAHL